MPPFANAFRQPRAGGRRAGEVVGAHLRAFEQPVRDGADLARRMVLEFGMSARLGPVSLGGGARRQRFLGTVEGPGDWALRISEALQAKEYVNPPGGVSLFDADKFKAANIKLEYSVWKPATSSDSASGRSKGTRFVSANAAIRKNRNAKICGKGMAMTNQFQNPPACASVIFTRLSEPDRRMTPTIARPTFNS